MIEGFQRRDSEKLEKSSDQSFGLVFTVFFIIVACWPLWKHGPLRVWALGLGGLFLLFSLLLPTALSPLNRAWTLLGALLHRMVSPLSLCIVFFLVVTPMALLLKARGKDLLRLRSDPKADSYWIPRKPPGPDPKNMNHLF